MSESSRKCRVVSGGLVKSSSVTRCGWWSRRGTTFKAAAAAVGVSDQSLRAWHAKFAPPPEPCGENASVEELREENSAAPQAARAGRAGA